jgi:hypothetical protein
MVKKYADRNNLTEITPEDEQNALKIPAYNKIREMLKGNDGYVFAFVRFHFEHGASLNDLEELYQKIKENAGSLNSLPMSIEEYSKQEIVNGVNPFEALMDQFHNIQERRKYRWIIDKVNRDLRNNIKALPPQEISRLYKAAKLIDDADADAGDYIDPETNRPTNNRMSLLKKSNAFTDAMEYIKWAEEMAQGVSNSDLLSKVNSLRALQPEAGIVYNGGGYLVLSIRTENAQKELCSVANWCINRGSWGSYGGQKGALQYNIFNFNLPVTHPMHITGTTIYSNGSVNTSHDKNDDHIKRSSDPTEHFTKLGYPEELIKTLISGMDKEYLIKNIVADIGIDSSSPSELLTTLVKATYKMNLDIEEGVRNIMIGIVRDRLSKSMSREKILEIYMKFGVLSPFSGRILNILIPDLTDDEKTKLLNNNDQLINDPTRGLRIILSRVGRSQYPQLTAAVDNEEKIKDIISSGESITSEGF